MTAPNDRHSGATTTGGEIRRADPGGLTRVDARIRAGRRGSSTVEGHDPVDRRLAQKIDVPLPIATRTVVRRGVAHRAVQRATTGRAVRRDRRVGPSDGRDHGVTTGPMIRVRSSNVSILGVIAMVGQGVTVATRGDDVADHQITIAIDGPAAAGKSTVGEIVAHRLSAVYFDTGLLYRAVTRAGIDRGLPLDDGARLAEMVRACDITVRRPTVADGRQSDVLVDGTDVTTRLRGPDIDRNVSVVAAHPAVREALLETQRQIGRSGRVVMVGRDIGTVVLPDAEVKIFLDASPEERARRRFEQMSPGDPALSYEQILNDMRRRDAIDSQRDVAPLRPAVDAVVIDSDPLTVEDVAERIIEVAREVAGSEVSD
jgi:CMP/dCMP kinase